MRATKAAPCPDDLVALARRRALSSLEAERHAEHVVTCGYCQAAAAVGRDFDHMPSLLPGDELIIDRVADRVAARAAATLAGKGRLARGWVRVLTIAAGVLLLVGGVATGARLIARRAAGVPEPAVVGETGGDPRARARAAGRRTGGGEAAQPPAEAPPLAPAELPTPPTDEQPAARPAAPASMPGATGSTASLSPPPTSGSPDPRGAGTPPRRPGAKAKPMAVSTATAGRRGPSSPEPALAPAPAAPLASELPSAAPRPETAVDLLLAANRHRRAGQAEAAVGAYRYLQVRFPDSAEAAASHVSLGRVLLERGRSAEALAAFERYLAQHSSAALVEEALDGKAAALAGLGRSADERATLSELVRRFPGSAYAPRARRRLGLAP
jgi:TolA-binding protein